MDTKLFQNIQKILDVIEKNSEAIDKLANLGIKLDEINIQLAKKDKELSKELTGELALLAESLQELVDQNRNLYGLAEEIVQKK